MRCNVRKRHALGVAVLLGTTAAAALGIDSFLDGNPQAPEALPYARPTPATAVPTTTTPSPNN